MAKKHERSVSPEASRKRRAISIADKPSMVSSSSSGTTSSTRMMQKQMESTLKGKGALVSHEVEIDMSEYSLDEVVVVLNKFLLLGHGKRLENLRNELELSLQDNLSENTIKKGKAGKSQLLKELITHELELLKRNSTISQRVTSIRAIFTEKNILPFVGDRGDGKSFNNMSMIIGLKNEVLGCEYRVDFDPEKGLHINLKMHENKYAIKVMPSSVRFKVSLENTTEAQPNLIKFKFWVKMTLGYYSTEREETLESRIRASYKRKENFDLKEELLNHVNMNCFEEGIEDTIELLENAENEAALFDLILSDDDPNMNVVRNLTINYFTTLLSGEYYTRTLHRERERTEIERTNVAELEYIPSFSSRKK